MQPTEIEEKIGKSIINACIKIHKTLGPGLLEKVYEICLAYELRKEGYSVFRQVNIPIQYGGIIFEEALRLDILVNELVLIEVKSVENVNPVWQAQVITQLKLSGKNLGFLVNFNVPVMKDGLKRFVN